MPVETGVTYITDLDPANPFPGDTKSQGDDHIRLIKGALKNTFPDGTKPFHFPHTVNITNANYTIVKGDDNTIFRVTTGTTDRTLTLPTLLVADAGWGVAIIKVDAAVGKVIVEGPGAVVVNGSPNVWLTERYSNTRILWTGYEYVTINDDTAMLLKNMAADRLIGRSDTAGPAQEIEPEAGQLEIVSGKLRIASAFGGALLGPGMGLLTPDSGIPIPTATNNQKITTLYYTPYVGKLMPMWNPLKSAWVMEEFTEMLLTLSATYHVANKLYDVYAYYDTTVPATPVRRLVTGLTWLDSTPGACDRGLTTHAASLIRDPATGFYTNRNVTTVRNGALVMSSMQPKTGTYLGTLLIDDVAGKYTCDRAVGQDRIWGIWNVWNRYPIALEQTFTPAEWLLSADTAVRPAAGNAAHRITIVTGLQETPLRAELTQRIRIKQHDNTQTTWYVGMGWNSTTAVAKQEAWGNNGYKDYSAWYNNFNMLATLSRTYWLGTTVITALEYASVPPSAWPVEVQGADSMMRTFHSG